MQASVHFVLIISSVGLGHPRRLCTPLLLFTLSCQSSKNSLGESLLLPPGDLSSWQEAMRKECSPLLPRGSFKSLVLPTQQAMLRISSTDLLTSEAKAAGCTVAALTKLSGRTFPDIHVALILENYPKAQDSGAKLRVVSSQCLVSSKCATPHWQIRGPLLLHLKCNTHHKGRAQSL